MRNDLFPQLHSDLLWADPADEFADEDRSAKQLFYPNDVRGCSFFFTYEAATNFLETNSLLSIIRAHEAQLEGYKMHRATPTSLFPTVRRKYGKCLIQVITIFSAPNYCDCYNNKGAILKYDVCTTICR